MLKQLSHNGILVPDITLPSRLALTGRGECRELSPTQIEMALAWARKQGTPYVEDPLFVRNFLQDFSAALGVEPPLAVAEVDFGPALDIVQAERAARERLTPEERKALAAQRKAERERLKEQYGHAIVDGQRVEIGAYIAEPSGIFMGRGQHPLRGRWKEGPRQSDVTLNLSPDAPVPPGDWAEIVWEPESLWVARWKDKLSGRLKYVWLSDTAPVKQEREAAKFDRAVDLGANLAQVRAHIEQGLTSPRAKRRRVATACYLIDALCLRVGDEKDPDEADTVGATTLRPEHVTLHPDGTAEFKFLGKDSVLWHKTIPLPPLVMQNLADLIREARPPASASNGKRLDVPIRATRDKPQIFPGVGSADVNAYLSEALPGLTAKVFRTHHATQVVRDSLSAAEVEAGDLEYKKWGAVALANLEAAVLCNHYKAAPANWQERRQRANERRKRLEERVAACRPPVLQASEALVALQQEAREKQNSARTDAQRERLQTRYARKIEKAEKKLATASGKLERAEAALGKASTQDTIADRGRTWNLGTSLKSYIDPRVFYQWGQQVEYDVLGLYYPTALQRKFAWVSEQEHPDQTLKVFRNL
jgi:DNA topoisomerase-1